MHDLMLNHLNVCVGLQMTWKIAILLGYEIEYCDHLSISNMLTRTV